MGWTETFGTGKSCILWWLSCVAGVDGGGEGNVGKKNRRDGGEKERTAPPFSLSRFSPPPLPSPFFCNCHAGCMTMCYLFKPRKNLAWSWEIVGIGHFHEQGFWLEHVQFKHFLGLFPYKPDILTQTHGPSGKKADCPLGQMLSVYCIVRQYLTLKVIVQLFELTKVLNSLLVCCFSWPSGRQPKK